MSDTIYTEGAGTNCSINGEPGVVTAIRRVGRQPVEAFARIPGTARHYFLILGNATDESRKYHEVLLAREIDRDEFDHLAKIPAIRESLGWVA